MIQIHCTDTNGNAFIMNRFSGENVEAGRDPVRLKALRKRAIHMAGEWSKVYPHDKFKVVDVSIGIRR